MRFKYYTGFIYPDKDSDILVVGTNYKGVHGAGAAKYAKTNYGLIWGVSEGFSGRCYAIPTKDLDIKSLPLDMIEKHVERFIDQTYIKNHLTFYVTPIATGLAGYNAQDIAPMFRLCNRNCIFEIEWQEYLETIKE